MNIIFLLIIVSLLIALGFLGAFFWAVRTGQYDDDHTPAVRMLFDDRPSGKPATDSKETTEKTSS